MDIKDTETCEEVVFESNSKAAEIYGPNNLHLTMLEHAFEVLLQVRGHVLAICGTKQAVRQAQEVIAQLWQKQQQGIEITKQEVDASVRFVNTKESQADMSVHFQTRKKKVYPRSPKQAIFMDYMNNNDLTFAVGPAGTGKTWLAVAKAVEALSSGEVERIILTRPALEAGEKIGFLPGDMQEKIDPYLRPLYDAINDMMPKDFLEKRLVSGEIEIAPLAFMRGRTLKNAFVILDEAQNTTEIQMKMFLTRLGEGSCMVVTGDLTQVDLPTGVKSGLRIAIDKIRNLSSVAVVHFDERDVVRHDLVARIIEAWREVT